MRRKVRSTFLSPPPSCPKKSSSKDSRCVCVKEISACRGKCIYICNCQLSEVRASDSFFELRYESISEVNFLPSQTVLEQKKAIVAELSERLKNSITGLVVCYEGINTEDDTKLRKELRENNVKYSVVKNTLLSRACDEVGLEDLKPVLEGTTALATSDSEYAAAARILCKYAKGHENFKVKSGRCYRHGHHRFPVQAARQRGTSRKRSGRLPGSHRRVRARYPGCC